MTRIREVKQDMIDASVTNTCVSRLSSGNQSLQSYCASIRRFVENVSALHNCDGMRSSLKRLKKLCNWAAHDAHDRTYKHTNVTDQHMRDTLTEFTHISRVLIKNEEEEQLSAAIDCLGLY